MTSHIPSRVQAVIKAIGHTMTYRQLSSSRVGLSVTQTFVDISVTGTIRMFKDVEIGGLVQEGDRKVYIAALELGAVIPKPNDKIISDGETFNVYSINKRKTSGTNAIYIMHVRGGSA